MQVFNNVVEWQNIRKSFPNSLSIGFVPTMGNLHIGHLSLIKKCNEENDLTIVSLFVNKTQFNSNSDYTNYPITLDKDFQLLKENNVDYCFMPNYAAMYPDDFKYQVVEIDNSTILEGSSRPGHFTGVLTVVMKLFNIIKPHRAYFGEKDYQQYQLIKDMANSFFMDIEIIVCPTIREESGLAYSSRNNLLNAEQKDIANKFATIFHSAKSAEEAIYKLDSAGIEVIYIKDHKNRRYAAVKVGLARLIDNIVY